MESVEMMSVESMKSVESSEAMRSMMSVRMMFMESMMSVQMMFMGLMMPVGLASSCPWALGSLHGLLLNDVLLDAQGVP